MKKNDKPMSRSQIAESLQIEKVDVSKILKQMLKFKDVECIELDRYEAAKLLGWDSPWRRTRFYYIPIEN